MKKFLLKTILRLLSIKDILCSEQYELKATYKDDTVYTLKFSNEIINKLVEEDSVKHEVTSTRKKRMKK